jgi:hypothetical protein
MQKRSRRIMGMTGVQLFVLGCLGLAALGVMGLTGWIVLGNADPFGLLPAQPAPVDLPTAVPLPTHTPLNTRTPILPTLTFTPTTYESLIPAGWKQYTVQKVEIWVPSEFTPYAKGKALIDLDGPKDANGLIHSMLTVDKESGVNGDLDDYIRALMATIPADITFLEKKEFPIGEYESARLKLQVIVSDVSGLEALYLVKDGSTVWLIGCVTLHDEFRDKLPTFDQIARTFRIRE